MKIPKSRVISSEYYARRISPLYYSCWEGERGISRSIPRKTHQAIHPLRARFFLSLPRAALFRRARAYIVYSLALIISCAPVARERAEGGEYNKLSFASVFPRRGICHCPNILFASSKVIARAISYTFC